jgi:hypothetical protein
MPPDCWYAMAAGSRAASSALSRRRSLLCSVGDGTFQDVWSIGELLVLPGVCPWWLSSAQGVGVGGAIK